MLEEERDDQAVAQVSPVEEARQRSLPVRSRAAGAKRRVVVRQQDRAEQDHGRNVHSWARCAGPDVIPRCHDWLVRYQVKGHVKRQGEVCGVHPERRGTAQRSCTARTSTPNSQCLGER